ncbi:anthocyanidin-3-O-glucoside rhamnosyltransferase-like [Ipomoea triloba]|uniref:anthocyanidin-3-O-glucoside rhamnosyltransferase-like n=1 Tax=Ipomoea triloba TaxID=35885 RepID=UPI00125D008A|nr:anthocyanidin-3-O-glucoside rhamnosyltransferase-like [Ipomoea triloba]
MERETTNNHLHVVMFPFFAFGHISPFVQLSNKLSLHGVKISFFSAAGNIGRIKSMLNSDNTQIVPLTLPAVEGLPPGAQSTADLPAAAAELLPVALNLMQPQIKALLVKLKPHFVIFDFAQDWLPPLAAELGIKTIFYSVFVALATAFATVPARLPGGEKSPTVEEMKKLKWDFSQQKPPPGFPTTTSVASLRTFEARDFLYIFKTPHDGGGAVYDRVLAGLKGCSAILAKTCYEMEAPYIDYVKSQFKKPFLLAGPVVPEPVSGELDQKWADWLSQFEPSTVIYCSFGSETFLKDDEIKELALGLELTCLPFFLVLNFPANVDVASELNRALPAGFTERVKGRGIIHSGWVQQQQILAHSSVGCYVCHAGFSSVIEGIVNECQLVILPLKGDQFMNAKLLAGDMKIGVEVNRRDEDGYFWKEDIQKAMQTITGEEGASTRANQAKWKEFLVDKEIQSKFIKDLVKVMRDMATMN